MITWLASYPRSGNTLLRTVLHRTMGLRSCSDEWPETEGFFRSAESSVGRLQGDLLNARQIEAGWEAFYEEASASERLYLVKTHRPPRDDRPAVYVLRDGRKASYSFLKFLQHYHPEAERTLLDVVLGDTYYGQWSDHLRAWEKRAGGPLHLVRYEDLVCGDPETLRELAAFVGHEGEIRAWENPFEEMREVLPSVFREGKIEWEEPEEWTELVDLCFRIVHGAAMERFGYFETGEDRADVSEDVGELVRYAERVAARNLQLTHELEQVQRGLAEG